MTRPGYLILATLLAGCADSVGPLDADARIIGTNLLGIVVGEDYEFEGPATITVTPDTALRSDHVRDHFSHVITFDDDPDEALFMTALPVAVSEGARVYARVEMYALGDTISHEQRLTVWTLEEGDHPGRFVSLEWVGPRFTEGGAGWVTYENRAGADVTESCGSLRRGLDLVVWAHGEEASTPAGRYGGLGDLAIINGDSYVYEEAPSAQCPHTRPSMTRGEIFDARSDL